MRLTVGEAGPGRTVLVGPASAFDCSSASLEGAASTKELAIALEDKGLQQIRGARN